MSNDSGLKLPPFPSSYRASGLLLHITLLPSAYIDDLAARLQDEGAKSFVSSRKEFMEVIVSKSATLAKVG